LRDVAAQGTGEASGGCLTHSNAGDDVTTLATMKARIASELRRTNITTQIASAIETAIESYRHERFWFSETREISFNTVANQWQYDSSDDADLGNVLRWDYVLAQIGDEFYTLSPMDPGEIETLNGAGDFLGQPLNWGYYNEQFLIYPIPVDVYPIRIGGMIAKASPASDAEANNPWMTHAEKLIRCRAKYELYTHVLMDQVMAAQFNPDNDMGPTAKALSELRMRTNWLTNTGGGFCVTPTQF